MKDLVEFEIDQNVWFMYENAIRSGAVAHVRKDIKKEITYTKKITTTIIYGFGHVFYNEWKKPAVLDERWFYKNADECFATKQDLINTFLVDKE